MVRADSAFPRAPLKVLADGEWLAAMPMDSAQFTGIYDARPYWSWWYEGEFVLDEGHRKIEFPELPEGYLCCNGNVCTNWYLPFIRFGKRTTYELFLEYMS